MTLVYQVMVQGNAVGTATNTLAREGEGWAAEQTVQAGPHHPERGPFASPPT